MNITRRDAFKNLSLGAGAFLLAPFLRQVQLQAAGNSLAIPNRFVFVVKSSGIVPNGITPEAFKDQESSSSLFNQDLTKVALPSSMRALEPFKDLNRAGPVGEDVPWGALQLVWHDGGLHDWR
jgi:hypothetical protein